MIFSLTRLFTFSVRLPVVIVSTLFIFLAIAGCNSTIGGKGIWTTIDLHLHSCFTDGEYSVAEILDKGIEYNVDLLVSSDHGGVGYRRDDCTPWEDIPGTEFSGDPITNRQGSRGMWRWQSLIEYGYPIVRDYQERYPDKAILLGYEWNPPGFDHVSVGIITDTPFPIAQFEYTFDRNDRDLSGGPDGTWGKNNGREGGSGEFLTHEMQKAASMDALRWLRKHHPGSSYVVINHPERIARVTTADMREWNDTAPDIAFGFEAAPGHQKTADRPRGYYPLHYTSEASNNEGTYGGFGKIAAEIGGAWDSLLGEGRRFWAFAGSDFHHHRSDFWPGEYTKTHVKTGRVSPQGILDGMRSGNVFVTHGDLISHLDFQAAAGEESATMGQELSVSRGANVTITIRFREPGKNHNGDTPVVRAVQLIDGKVSEPADPGTPAYESDHNPTTKITKIFRIGEWETSGSWNELSYTFTSVKDDFYVRLRGTGYDPSTPYHTDSFGNPLNDNEAREATGISGTDHVWADLWFYANPIFIHVE